MNSQNRLKNVLRSRWCLCELNKGRSVPAKSSTRYFRYLPNSHQVARFSCWKDSSGHVNHPPKVFLLLASTETANRISAAVSLDDFWRQAKKQQCTFLMQVRTTHRRSKSQTQVLVVRHTSVIETSFLGQGLILKLIKQHRTCRHQTSLCWKKQHLSEKYGNSHTRNSFIYFEY